MTRQLKFDPAKKLYFRMVYPAFITRGSAPQDKRVSEEEVRSDARILKALKTISDPIGDLGAEEELDGRPRSLKLEGGVLTLSQPDFTRLSTYLKSTQWMSASADVAVDLIDWFDTADKIEKE